MTKLLSVFLLGASLGAPAVQAQAPFPPPPAPAVSGPYLGGLLGRAQAKKGCLGFLGGSSRRCDDVDPAWGLFAGYQFNRFIAGEAAFVDLGRVRSSTATATETIHASAWEITGVGFVPIDRDFALFGRIGGYRATLDSGERGIADHTNGGLTYGGGLQWAFPRGLGLRGQWQRYKDVGGEGTLYGVNIYDVLSLAVLWRWQ